jgi:hypothetical protein
MVMVLEIVEVMEYELECEPLGAITQAELNMMMVMLMMLLMMRMMEVVMIVHLMITMMKLLRRQFD